jgi:hypothetical protein
MCTIFTPFSLMIGQVKVPQALRSFWGLCGYVRCCWPAWFGCE